MKPFYEQFTDLLQQQVAFVVVTLVHTTGSAPQEPGAKMLVTRDGLVGGTVGGGKVEKRAIEEALILLESTGTDNLYREWSLTTDIGMTCGGSVRFYFERVNATSWPIVIFGAGHVAQALIRILIHLDCRVTCIDPRPEWLDRLPDSPRLARHCVPHMPDWVPQIPEGAFVALMSMGHSTDMPVLLEILRQREFPYLGVIGSRAKAARLRKDIQEAGLPSEFGERFHCPIGLELGNNQPYEIAISIAAQLLQERDRLAAERNQ